MRNYTTVVATFNITTSKCAGILINPCEFEAYCSLWLHIKTKKMSLCDNYLQSFSSKQVKVVKEERYILVFMNLKLLKNNQHDYGACVHLYLSSDVVARFQNVFQNDFNNNVGDPDCYVHIKVESDTGFTHNILTSTYQGTIKRTETLELVGHGNVVNHNFLVEEKKIAPFINIHKCKHKVKLKATAAVIFESIGKMLPGRVTIFTLAVRRRSSSTMMLRFEIHNSSLKGGRWKTCGSMSQKYQIPIMSNVSSTVFDLLSNALTVTYGKILNIVLSTEYSGGYTFMDYTVQLIIKSLFCFFKHIRPSLMDYSKVLNEYDPFDTESLFSEMYDNKCNGNDVYRLHWSQIMALPHCNNTKVLSRVLLPGIYEQATIKISHTSSQQTHLLYLDVTWTDTNILEKVDISLQLNGRQYQIFKHPRKSNIMYTWMEAEELCIHLYSGHLPSISSQSDVQDLVNIILRAVWIGPIRMIYIGLKVSN